MQPMVADSFARRLNKALDAAGIAQGRGRRQAVSKMFSVSLEAVRKWLTGESFPETKRIPEIAEKLGVRAEWLLTGTGSMQASAEPPAAKSIRPAMAGDLRHLWQLALDGRLSREDVALLVKVADRLAQTKGRKA